MKKSNSFFAIVLPTDFFSDGGKGERDLEFKKREKEIASKRERGRERASKRERERVSIRERRSV